MDQHQHLKGRVEYVPPPSQTLHAYARAVCEALAQHRQNPALADQDVINGLAHFLEVVTRIHARYLSSGDGLLDEASE